MKRLLDLGGKWRYLLCALLLSCSGAGAPPSPLVEVPSVVSFPSDLSIGVDSLDAEPATALKLQTVKTDFSEDIFGAFLVGGLIGTFVDRQLVEFNELFDFLQIPVSPAVTRVVQSARFRSGSFKPDSTDIGEIILPLLAQIAESESSGRFDPEGDVAGAVKIDFADFDVDGDGKLDGCTGCTCPAGCAMSECPRDIAPADLKPVCFQLWVDNEGTEVFKRLLAGRFDRLRVPATGTEPENRGSGLYIQRYSFPDAPQVPSFGIRVGYDHSDLADKFTDFSIRSDDPVFTSVVATFLDNVRVSVAQQGAEERTSTKTVKFAQECRPGSEADCEKQNPVGRQVSRFREDGNLWSGSGENPFADPPTFTNACVLIDTGTLAEDPQSCEDLGIAVAGEGFIDFVRDADVQYPVGFLASPGF